MKPVTVGRYGCAGKYPPDVMPMSDEAGYWLGWVCTEDWIVWEGADGKLYVNNGRESGGAIRVASTVVERA